MLPLANRRVLVTRARNQVSALAAQLQARGAEVISIPAIEIAPPQSYCALDAALASSLAFDWMVFTSANAVRAFVGRGSQTGVTARARSIAVIGPATARAVEESGLADKADLMPSTFVAEALADALLPHAAGASILLVRAEKTREVLPEALTAGGATVTVATAYRTVIPESSVSDVRRLFTERVPDAITFTSASTSQNLRALIDVAGVADLATAVLASIGPITSAAMREVGMEPAVEATEATIGSLVAAIVEHFAS